jgi:putative membrane protein
LNGYTENFGGTDMIHRLTMHSIAIGLLIAPAALAQMNHPNSVVGPAAATASKDALGQQDANFVKEATAGGMAEIELSKIAEKTENPEVKRFAERMVRDHTAANAELTGITTGLNVETPKTLDADHQKIRDRLRNMHGKDFDRQYMQIMVEDHDQAVKLFRQEASLGHDLKLKQFAQNTLPTLEQHQKMALDLSRRLSETAAR